MQSSRTGLPKEVLEVLLDVPIALAFGLAALWLLASYLGRRHRFRTFLGILAVLVVFIVFSFAATAGVGETALPLLVPLALLASVVAAAMVLCGLACRGRHRPFRLCLWLFLSLLAVWVAVSALLHFLYLIASRGSVDYALFLGIGPLMVFARTLVGASSD